MKYNVYLNIHAQIDVNDINDESEVKQKSWEAISNEFLKEIFADGDRKLNPEKFLEIEKAEE